MTDDYLDEDALDVQEAICIALGHTLGHVFADE